MSFIIKLLTSIAHTVLLPALIEWVTNLYKTFKKNKAISDQAKQDIAKAEKYEANPTADNLNSMP